MLAIALLLAGNVAYASVFGLIAIFASAKAFALSMGITIEIAKLVSISYLYRHWTELTNKYKYMLLSVTMVTILVSALGVFGFLSRAHIENGNPIANNNDRLVFIEEQIELKTENITQAKRQIEAMNAEIDKLIKFDKVSGTNGSIATRTRQDEQRRTLNTMITDYQNGIVNYQEEKLELSNETNKYSVEIGPIRYVAELLWDSDESSIDKAVRLLIMLIMFIFDPLAILLLIGANQLYLRKEESKIPVIVDDDVSSPEIHVEEDDENDEENHIEDKIDSLSSIVETLAVNVNKQYEQDNHRSEIVKNIRQNK